MHFLFDPPEDRVDDVSGRELDRCVAELGRLDDPKVCEGPVPPSIEGREDLVAVGLYKKLFVLGPPVPLREPRAEPLMDLLNSLEGQDRTRGDADAPVLPNAVVDLLGEGPVEQSVDNTLDERT